MNQLQLRLLVKNMFDARCIENKPELRWMSSEIPFVLQYRTTFNSQTFGEEYTPYVSSLALFYRDVDHETIRGGATIKPLDTLVSEDRGDLTREKVRVWLAKAVITAELSL